MGLPTTAHIIYIPLVLLIGIVLGFIWGGRSTREAITLEARRQEELARKKADRAAARAKAKETEPGEPPAEA